MLSASSRPSLDNALADGTFSDSLRPEISLRVGFQCVSVACASGTARAYLNPLVAVLLLARPRLGVMLTLAIITSEVVLNARVGARIRMSGRQIAALCLGGMTSVPVA